MAFNVGTAEIVAETNLQILTLKNNREYKLQVTKISCKTHLTQITGTFAEIKTEAAFSSPKKIPVRLTLVKPSICILEPFIITDFDYKANKIFLDLNPLAAINCRGILAGENVAIEEIGKAAQTIVRDLSEIVAEKTGLLVTDEKVGFLTKKLLRDLNCIETKG